MSNGHHIICEVCGSKAKSKLKSRNICERCYRREDRISCTRCGHSSHSISQDSGLCPRCTTATARPMEKCTRCSRIRPMYNVEEGLCHPCHKYSLRAKNPYAQCSRCKSWARYTHMEAGLCSRCMSASAKLEDECTHCHHIRVIHNQKNGLCYLCHQNLREQARKKNNPNRFVKCSICGKIKLSLLSNRTICVTCHREELNGSAQCAICQCIKAIYCKGKQLCRLCYKNSVAAKSLHKYIANYTTPYPYNKQLFDFLATTLDEDALTERINRRLRTFGQFLQINKITEPLSWQAIEELLPPLGATNRVKTRYVRESLLALGHLMAAKGLIESRETYNERHTVELKINHAPQHIQRILHLYASWLWERKLRWHRVYKSITVLASFWSWCDSYGIRFPHEVSTPVINNYFMTLYWQWFCSNCNAILTFTPNDRQAPRTCLTCGSVGSIAKVDRFDPHTILWHNSVLHVFFDWAKSFHKVISNPVRRKISLREYPIRHYPFEDIKRLCQYISAPDSDPIEALALYLIIFHALSVWELRHAELPAIHKLYGGIEIPSFANIYYILVPRREPSRGDRSPGRPDVRVDFPDEAAHWLKPLLERFEQTRQKSSKNRSNTYLFPSSHSTRHNIPVGRWFVGEIVHRASKRVLGAVCTPKILRLTAALMFVDRANGGILKWMGWSTEQGFNYMWASREVIHPYQ
jgi:hypothetical protein